MSAWNDAEQAARTKFMWDAERATVRGHPLSDDRVYGSGEGWDAAIEWVKAERQASAGKPLIDVLDDLTGKAADAALDSIDTRRKLEAGLD